MTKPSPQSSPPNQAPLAAMPADPQIMNHPRIEQLPTSELRENPNNARTHDDKQYAALEAAIRKFSWLVPIVVDADLMILAGNARFEVAKRMGLETVPCIRADHLSETDKRAFALGENRLAEISGWNPELLQKELDALFNVGFEIETIGFSTKDLTIAPVPQNAEEDDSIPPIAEHAVTQPGYAWRVGPHIIVQGDSQQAEPFEKGLQGRVADMVFGDLPYNLPVDGFVRGKGGKNRFREFAFASGEMTPPEFTAFQRAIFRNCVRFSKPASIHFQCMDNRHLREILDAADGVYTEFKQLIVWDKQAGGLGSFYRSQYELIFVFKSGRGKHTNTFGLGQHGRFRTNLWSYPGIGAMGKGRAKELACHATPKSIPMVMDAIRDCSHPGELILDPCLGSGVTGAAAHKTGRVCVGIEIDPLYVDVAVKRLAAVTGIEPILEGDGRTFNEIAATRGISVED